ncbi:TPR repeat containing exported protein; Putative periplasmic protein contains a protein prenylyltransferase domain [hydrothermal vent metagenome]|uniref:TPR repeat containing exported protein Putative periplasmic protein contains a protein prenylyltransferase domain n=1 Tax=hydrothermal vent metagenome TaxID=652676 RepID=A0A1W1CZL4_9ZZZZ
MCLKSKIKAYTSAIVFLSIFSYAETISYDFDDIGVVSSQSSVPINVSGMRQRILEQDERIDGLTTIIEGLSASLNDLHSRSIDDNIQTTETKVNEDDTQAVLLKKLASMIDDINAKYVTRQEVQGMIRKQSLGKTEAEIVKKEATQTEKPIAKNKTTATMYTEGVRHFFKKRYTEAKKQFLLTDKKGYKPAASNYYLGEIAYYSNAPKDAIFYFKKSAGLYGDASYMDTLLLHTAISLAKTGEKGQARAFFENIIATYPKKKTARIAKDRLEKL